MKCKKENWSEISEKEMIGFMTEDQKRIIMAFEGECEDMDKIAERTGFDESRVAVLLDELIEMGLVDEKLSCE